MQNVTVFVFLLFLTQTILAESLSADESQHSKGTSAEAAGTKDPAAKRFPGNFETLISKLRDSLPFALEPVNSNDKTKSFQIGGKDSVFPSLVKSIKDYREKLALCKPRGTTEDLSALIDEYINYILDQIEAGKSGAKGNVSKAFAPFVKDLLDPHKDKRFQVSEKVIATYTLQLKKVLTQRILESEGEDQKASYLIGQMGAVLSGNSPEAGVSESTFDESAAWSDSRTKPIVEKARQAAASAKGNACKLGNQSVASAPTSTSSEVKPLAESKPSSNPDSKEDKDSKDLDFKDDKLFADDRKDDKSLKDTPAAVASPPPAATAAAPSTPFTPLLGGGLAERDKPEMEGLKGLLDGLRKSLEDKLKDAEGKGQAVADKDNGKGFPGMLPTSGEGNEKKGSPQGKEDGAGKGNPTGQKEPEKKEDKPEQAKKDEQPKPSMGNPQMPQLPPSQEAKKTEFDAPKLNLEPKDKPASTPPPASQDPRMAANMEMLQLQTQMGAMAAGMGGMAIPGMGMGFGVMAPGAVPMNASPAYSVGNKLSSMPSSTQVRGTRYRTAPPK